MKKITGFVVCFVLLMGSLAYAEGAVQSFSHGSTIVPGIHVWKHSTNPGKIVNELYLSNITGQEIECTVRLINHEGGESNQFIQVYSGNMAGGSANLIGTSNAFTIPANSSRWVRLSSSKGSSIFGYANVSWKCAEEKITKAMVGLMRRYLENGSRFSTATCILNNGQPF